MGQRLSQSRADAFGPWRGNGEVHFGNALVDDHGTHAGDDFCHVFVAAPAVLHFDPSEPGRQLKQDIWNLAQDSAVEAVRQLSQRRQAAANLKLRPGAPIAVQVGRRRVDGVAGCAVAVSVPQPIPGMRLPIGEWVAVLG